MSWERWVCNRVPPVSECDGRGKKGRSRVRPAAAVTGPVTGARRKGPLGKGARERRMRFVCLRQPDGVIRETGSAELAFRPRVSWVWENEGIEGVDDPENTRVRSQGMER